MKKGDPTGYTLLGFAFGAAGGFFLWLGVVMSSPPPAHFGFSVGLFCVAPVVSPIAGSVVGASLFGAVFKATDPNRKPGEPPK